MHTRRAVQPCPNIFSPDGRYILTGSTDGTAQLRDRESGKTIQNFSGHNASLLDIAYSPDGKYAVTAGIDNVARLWDIKTGRELRQFTGHTDGVTAVAFSPDSK